MQCVPMVLQEARFLLTRLCPPGWHVPFTPWLRGALSPRQPPLHSKRTPGALCPTASMQTLPRHQLCSALPGFRASLSTSGLLSWTTCAALGRWWGLSSWLNHPGKWHGSSSGWGLTLHLVLLPVSTELSRHHQSESGTEYMKEGGRERGGGC